MPKVWNWEIYGTSPYRKVKASDMRYGVGYMNDILLDMTASMSDLLARIGESREVDLTLVSKNFMRSTLGRQVGMIREKYDGVDLVYSKMEEIVRLRNHFIHDFRTSSIEDYTHEAKILSDLINLIIKVTGQLDNANRSVSKSVAKTKNIKRNEVVNVVRSSAKCCKEYKKGRVDLKDLSQVLRTRMSYDKRLYKFLKDNGIESYYDERDRTIRYIKLSEL